MTEINKYNTSKIYKIQSSKTNMIYIGSTTQTLPQRLSKHVGNYKDYLRNEKGYMTSFDILKFEDYYISLIEECNFNNRQQLFKYEGEIIRQNINIVVNKVINGRTLQEYRNDNKDIIKQKKEIYNEIHKEINKEKNKQYYNDNKQIIAEKRNQYNIENKQIMIEKNKQYYNDNKQIIAEKAKKNVCL